jgi:hypothetical protein
MSRTKAALILDPDRRAEQLAYLSERVRVLHEVGDQLWVSMTEDQSDRLAGQGIVVQLHVEADLIELPSVTFDPSAGSPEPPEDLRATPPPQGATGSSRPRIPPGFTRSCAWAGATSRTCRSTLASSS